MYEPPTNAGPGPASQWGPYEPTSFVPPQDDYAPEPSYAPPPGRHYAQYRQPPTWQHASMRGMGDVSGDLQGAAGTLVAAVVQGLAAIVAGGAIGYVLTGNWKGAGGGALAVMGAAQLPYIFTGGFTRAFIAAGALGGSYYLLRDMSPVLGGEGQAYPNSDEDDDFEENDDEDDDDNSSPPQKEPGGKPSDDPERPAPASPFMRPGNPFA